MPAAGSHRPASSRGCGVIAVRPARSGASGAAGGGAVPLRSAAAADMPAKKCFRRRREDSEEEEEDEQVAEEVRWVGSGRRARLGPPPPALRRTGPAVPCSVVSRRGVASYRHLPLSPVSAASRCSALLRVVASHRDIAAGPRRSPLPRRWGVCGRCSRVRGSGQVAKDTSDEGKAQFPEE